MFRKPEQRQVFQKTGTVVFRKPEQYRSGKPERNKQEENQKEQEGADARALVLRERSDGKRTAATPWTSDVLRHAQRLRAAPRPRSLRRRLHPMAGRWPHLVDHCRAFEAASGPECRRPDPEPAGQVGQGSRGVSEPGWWRTTSGACTAWPALKSGRSTAPDRWTAWIATMRKVRLTPWSNQHARCTDHEPLSHRRRTSLSGGCPDAVRRRVCCQIVCSAPASSIRPRLPTRSAR